MDETEVAPRPIVILDTNTIQHALNPETGPEIQQLISGLLNDDNALLGFSNITILEAFKNIVFNPAKYNPVVDYLNKYLVRYEVTQDILASAATLHDLYCNDDTIKGLVRSVSNEDMIIGVTAIHADAYLLTSDVNGYPAPFFTEVYKQIFFYRKGGQQKYIVKYLLKPDQEMINSAAALLTPESEKSNKTKANASKKSDSL